MTFTEAAVEVLRLVGKPLHYKKITEVAIERNLLSHVGKTPEVTMSSRLATMVKRDRGEAPIIKVKPGVFGLREFNEEQLADLSGDVDELPEVDVDNEQDKAPELAGSAVELPLVTPSIEPRKPLPGADVFPEEEDDDEPILGGDDDDDEDEEGEGEVAAGADAQPGAESRSSRRRRKRRRRGGAEEATEPEARVEARPVRELPVREPRVAREPRREDSPRRDARRERDDRSRDERISREERSREERGREERGREERSRDERSSRDERIRADRSEREEPLDAGREPGDGDLLGKDLADAVASVLAQGGPRGLPVMRIADQLVRRGRLQGDPSALLPTIMAAVRADIARKRIEQTRPRFRTEAGAVVLTEFLLPQDVLRAEQDVLRAAERQRERVRRAFLRRLGELPGAGVAELIATWLNAEGVVGLRAVRRPGAGVGELHLAGTLRRGADELRLAIVVYREARELSRERVIEARGALHYYGHASLSWLITFGNVTSGAREEASAPAAGPVALFDGLSLATAMERQGVGLVTQQVPISALDYELLDALRGGQAPRDLDQERERSRDRGRDVGGRERDRGERERGDRGERDRHGEREAGGRERNERDRNERGERGERTERDRPRLALERARPALPELDDGEVDPELVDEEIESDVAIDEGDEVIDAALQDAGAGGEEGTAEGEAREGSRRRRRRRRRKGGRGEAQAGDDAQATTLEGGAEAGEGAGWAEGEDSESDEPLDGYARADAGQEGAPRYADDERSDDEEPLRSDERRDNDERSDDERSDERRDDDERSDDERSDDERSDDERSDDERDDDDERSDDERDDEHGDDERSDDERSDDERADDERADQDEREAAASSDNDSEERSDAQRGEDRERDGEPAEPSASERERHGSNNDDDSSDPYPGRRHG